MKIIIDLQSLQSGSRLGGIGRYSLGLTKAIIRNKNEHEIWIVLNDLHPDITEDIRFIFSGYISQDRIVEFNLPSNVSEIGNNSSKICAAELIREEFINNLDPDMILISSLFESVFEEIVVSVGQLSNAERTAVILYDLIPLSMKDRYLQDPDVLEYYEKKIQNLKNAGILLTISEFSRGEAINLLMMNPKKVVNISSAADTRFKLLDITDSDKNALLKKYNIKSKFLMYTGSFDRRKNHLNLIKAYTILPDQIRKEYQLLIVGNGNREICDEFNRQAKKIGIGDEFIFARRVNDSDLVQLYNLCSLFVFPSLSEGFGLPALEAMSCGTPVICSNCTSLPEVVGYPEAEFDPSNPKSIAEVIKRALTDDEFYLTLIKSAKTQVRKFSWDNTAKAAINALELQNEYIKKNSANENNNLIRKISRLDDVQFLSEGDLKAISQSISINRENIELYKGVKNKQKVDKKIGWVTSWNTRCGIAEYSRFLVSQFPADVSIFAPFVDEKNQKDLNNVSRCWEIGGPDDLTCLYNKVNSENIDILLIQFNYVFFDFNSFLHFLEKIIDRGIKVFMIFHSVTDNLLYENKQLISLVPQLMRCKGLLVHSENDKNILSEYSLQRNVKFMPHGIVETQVEENLELSVNNKFVIATYGFALPSKGLIEILKAFSILIEKNKERDFRLIMVNAEYTFKHSSKLISEINHYIEDHGLSDKVTLVTDFLSNENSLGFLQKADLIIYGYQNTGESSSAAVLMGIAANRPVAVTPSKIFDDVNSIIHKLPGYSSEEIAQGIEDTIKIIKENTPEHRKITNRASLWRKAHAYSRVSRYLYHLMNKL